MREIEEPIKKTGLDEEPAVLTCGTEDFEKAFLLLQAMLNPLDFSRPFKIEINYDPEQPRTKTKIYMPTEGFSRYNQKVKERIED